ncbi:acetaldehyde dehydrogenase (acetylating) [Desulfitobacterium dehalogenans ATCC 51507]|uniref:Acetaldehyde dehydrogenase (Acetylating) n=1 Tax=Desulfitobacterium dehalogenans (strain ATCC 51507 / DSM 9161 / JW/IU-DC1) TaxID=756499 RepID=I4AES4_DESDJ|nr:acetaldehyde dehydrogenase (acetylating) [Desulfitobacterium dehalogenans]AFM02459.1 acetaldehyde dehydrogenase (acetylating) [Desulfitobacterium dehalogenans ATCC 51507]
MNRMDNDLLSIQEARILIENAREAQKTLAAFPQEKLDRIVERIAAEVAKYARELAIMSYEETGFGKWQDKYIKNIFASNFLYKKISKMKVVGIIAEDKENQTIDVGVPVGVIVALLPSTNPVSTTIYKTLIAIKSGNAIVFSPHPKAKKTIRKVLEILVRTAEASGLPCGAIGYQRTQAVEGTLGLMNHKDTALIMVTGVPKMVKAAYASGKPTIYGGPGNGPAFIERSADIKQAVADIITSRTFDNGIVSASEQSIVAEECIADEVREELKRNGAYFLSAEESAQLGQLFLRSDGSANPDIVGNTAVELARKTGVSVLENTKVLISEQRFVAPTNPYAKEKLCPVLAFYVEKDWLNACEKCIELLLNDGRGHTLVIHSRNEQVIREFALKKPVSRVLVNTPATLGGIGGTTNLFPALTLGCGAGGGGFTSDNISPLNLINIRKIGYGVRKLEDITCGLQAESAGLTELTGLNGSFCSGTGYPKERTQDLNELLETLLEQLLPYRNA